MVDRLEDNLNSPPIDPVQKGGDPVARQNEAPLFQQVNPISPGQGPDGKPITQELATIRRNIFIGPTYGLPLRPRDPTLRTRGHGWDYEIYDQAEMDPKVYSALRKRQRTLSAYPVEVDAGGDRPVDIAAKELIERAIKAFNFPRLTTNLLDGISKGFAVSEVMWELVEGPNGKEWLVTNTLPRDQRRFRFDELLRLRLVDWENLITGEILPDRKFIVFTFEAKDGDPYGRGLGRILWWNAYFKRENQKAWLIANDKFAVPTAHGQYPAESSDEEKSALFNAVLSFSTDSAIISPEGTTIELIETARAAGADTFNVMREAQNEDIDTVVLGTGYAAHAGALDGGSGAATDQDDRLELAQADANELAFELNRTLVKWIVEVNLPDARLPTLRWLVDAEEDLNDRADRDSKIESMGFEPSEDYINKVYGGDWTKTAALAPVITDEANFAQRIRRMVYGTPREASPAEDGITFTQRLRQLFSFSQAPAKDVQPTDVIAGKLTGQLADFADPVIDHWVGEFRKVIDSSASLAEAQDRLIDLYSTMDGEHFAQTLAAAVEVADLAGRVDAKHGA